MKLKAMFEHGHFLTPLRPATLPVELDDVNVQGCFSTSEEVKSGDLVAAAAGTKAHQLINMGNVDLRYLGISSVAATEVVDYPDSGKIGVMAGVKDGDFRSATYSGMGRMEKADYYDGEDQ